MNRTGPVALTLGTLLLLASCTGEDADAGPKPTATSSSPSATTASPTPSETPPTMPAAAAGEFPGAAAAFVKHYVAVVNNAALTGDSRALSSLSSKACDGCQHYVDLFDGASLDRREPLWELDSQVEVRQAASGMGVITTLRALRDDGSREVYSMVFVVNDQPRRLVDLYRLGGS